jgi:hypothetical protein
MKTKKAIKILKEYQKWRIGETDKIAYTPKEISEALNKIINKNVKKFGSLKRCCIFVMSIRQNKNKNYEKLLKHINLRKRS